MKHDFGIWFAKAYRNVIPHLVVKFLKELYANLVLNVKYYDNFSSFGLSEGQNSILQKTVFSLRTSEISVQVKNCETNEIQTRDFENNNMVSLMWYRYIKLRAAIQHVMSCFIVLKWNNILLDQFTIISNVLCDCKNFLAKFHPTPN